MREPFRFHTHGITDGGSIRDTNQSVFRSLPTEGLFVVADGKGPHGTGDRAATIAADTLGEFFRDNNWKSGERSPFAIIADGDRVEHRVCVGVRLVHDRLNERIDGFAMGASIAALSMEDHRVQITHVGDCRLYRLRDAALDLLTCDHSLVNDYRRDRPTPTEEELASIPKNVLTRMLGKLGGQYVPDVGWRENLEIEARVEELRADDIYLLCTAGFHNVVDEHEIETALNLGAPGTLREAGQRLLDAALLRGVKAGITLLLVRIVAA